MRPGSLELRALYTPGHCPDHIAFLVDGSDCLTADCLFKGTVGGTANGGPTGYRDQVRSIMERLLALPPETRLHPGHREATTVAAELETNPFVRIWRGLDAEGDEPCTVRGEPATLVLWGRHDKLLPLACGEYYAQHIPGARLEVIENCGHMLPFEKQAEFVSRTVAFLQ